MERAAAILCTPCPRRPGGRLGSILGTRFAVRLLLFTAIRNLTAATTG